MSRAIEDVESEIEDVRDAITAVVRGGQSYSIGSGGSTRAVTQATIPELKAHLKDLKEELNELVCPTNTRGYSVGAGW